jgi:LysM repeat protein
VSGVWFGCVPIGDSPVDEEKDPNFIEGRNHLNAMDYKGAVEAFERALQANPRSASAHFELGVLYFPRLNDPVSAIYHYQKHLQLRPNSTYAQVARDQITACKMEMVKTVSFGVVTRDLHRDLQRMTNELGMLMQRNAALSNHLAAKPMIVTQWQTLRVTNFVNVPMPVTAAAPTPTPATNNVRPQVATATTGRSATNTARPANNPQQRQMDQRAAQSMRSLPSTPAMRKHVVRVGETMSQIARRYNVNPSRLQAANPTIEPRRLRAGQTLNIPTP